jgi:Protein of unknown function (DUF1697)
MTKYIALLRAVNVGGTGKLPMSELKAICRGAGFARVETYIASGNVVFEGKAAPSKVKAELRGDHGLDFLIGVPPGNIVANGGSLLPLRQCLGIAPKAVKPQPARSFSTYAGTTAVAGPCSRSSNRSAPSEGSRLSSTA